MNLLKLIVRIGADNRELTRTLKQSEKNITSMSRSVSNIGKAIGATFAVGAIVQFGRASVREFAAAESAMNRLGGSVRNAGGNFSAVRKQVEQLTGSMEDMSTFGDDELVAALQTVVSITNDVSGSMRELETVMNLAAGKQIELETAAELVGKAMAGNIGTLSRYGIVAKDSAQAMQILRERFRGMASQEANTLEGKMKQLTNEVGNFKEALGSILVGGAGAGDSFTGMIDGVRNLTRALEDNRAEWVGMRDDILSLVGAGATALAGLGKLHQWLRDVGTVSMPASAQSGLGWADRDADMRGLRTVGSAGAGGGGGVLSMAEIEAAAEAAAAAFDAKWGSMMFKRDAFSPALGTSLMNRDGSLMLKGSPTAPGMVQNKSASGALVLPGISTGGGGGGGGILNSIMGAAGGGLSAMFSGLMASLGPMTLAFEFLSSMFEAAGPAIQVLLMPVKMLGQLVGGVVNKALSYLAQGIGMVIKAIGWLIDKINIFGGDGGIQKFGQEMIDAAKAARAGTKAQENLTDAINETVLNVPRILNLSRLRFNGGAGGSGGSTGGSGGGGPLDVPTNRPPIGRGPSTGGGGRPVNEAAVMVVFNGPVSTADPDQLAETIGRTVERKIRNAGASRLSLSFAA